MTNTAPTNKNTAQILGNRIVSLYANINLATYHLLVLIGEFEENNFGEQQGFITTAHWLNYSCGIGLTAAREKVRVAMALRGLPKVAQCFSQGSVSYSKVRALTRVADADNEQSLLDIARHATAAQAERIFRQYKQTRDKQTRDKQTRDSAESSVEQAPGNDLRNRFSSYWDDQGNLVFRGRLSPEQGALVLAALQREQDDGAQTEDALAVVAQRALSSKDDGDSDDGASTNASAERYQIHVELDNQTQHLRGGPGITDKIIERLSCDASLVTHQCGSDGEPLNVGRKTRTIPPALRRALEKRDKGCRFPGCTHTRFVDAHHIQHWARGGETKLSNLVLLCTRHHRSLHEFGFRIEFVKPEKSAAQFRFYSPQGDYLPAVADDLSAGRVIDFSFEVSLDDSAEELLTQTERDASAEASHPSLSHPPLAPVNPTKHPDYAHINWVLTDNPDRPGPDTG